ncbi:MAG: OmpA family protein [Myxococcaceae bacterium]|nr:OmpA family protein [Myxococcaceae bacterium]
MIRSLVLVVLLAATGCAKKVKTSYLDEGDTAARKQADEGFQRLLSDCTLHFGYDDAMLTQADQTMLEKVALGLRTRPAVKIRIAGHADERGTEEYNLALGQRRADAARKYLMALGAAPEQVETVTFGEEVPAMVESSEEAWAWNRRDELGIAPLEMVGYYGGPVEVLK